jgi:hypothetical protein
MEGEAWIRLDIARDLIKVYREKGKDREARREIENLLFDEKVMAIRSKDLEARQRYHTTLGLIYTEWGQWGSEQDARSAVFQYQSALRAAADRTESEGAPYQPLPHLKRALGHAYARSGQAGMAGQSFAAAGEGYLDLDDLDEARNMVGQAEMRLGAEAVKGVKVVLDLKEEIRRISRSGADLSPARTEELARLVTAGVTTEKTSLAADFLRRQQFKMLSDLGLAAKRAGQLPASVALESRALQILAEGARPVSLGDVARIEGMQEVFSQVVRFTSKTGPVQTATGRKPREATPGTEIAVEIPLGTDRPPLQLVIHQDLRIAGQASREVIPFLGGQRPKARIEVGDGRITVPDLREEDGPEEEATNPKLIEALQRIKGVSEVSKARVEQRRHMTVPDVTGLTQDRALAQLRRLGLAGEIEVTDDPAASPGVVHRQSAKPGSLVPVGTTLTLRVGADRRRLVTVPELRGLTIEEAARSLKGSGLVQGAITRSPGVGTVDRITGQSPKAGERVAAGTRIDLTVAASRR